MQINSAEGIKLATRLYEKYGSWDAVKKATTYTNGKWVINSADSKEFVNDTKIGKNKSNHRKAGVFIALAYLVSFTNLIYRKK